MEEKNEQVVEETTQETTEQVDKSKFESAGNDIMGGGFDLGSFDPK